MTFRRMWDQTVRGPGPDFFRVRPIFLLSWRGGRQPRLCEVAYDAAKENFLYEIDGTDPFVETVPDDSPRFVPIRMALQNELLVDDLSYETRTRQRLGTWDAGRLVCGSADPNAADYTTLADICFGDRCAEVRLPCCFSCGDPPNMQVQQGFIMRTTERDFQPVAYSGSACGDR